MAARFVFTFEAAMFRNVLFLGALVLAACVRPTEPDSASDSHSSTPPPATSASSAPSASTMATIEKTASPATSSSAQANPDEPLDSLGATKAAQAKGLKVDLFVPHPVHCPAIPKPTGDPTLLQAKGKLAGLIVDMEGFMRTDMGVSEAVVLLGDPVLCSDGAVAGYMDMHLAPRDPSVHQVTLETHDGDLIGLIVEYEKTVPVDVAALEKPYGKSERHPGPMDSFEAGSDVFSFKNAAYDAQFMFAHRKHSDPPNARQVHQIIFRRISMLEILPEGFHSAPDVARLVALALRPKAAEAVNFAGTLGLYNPPVNRRMTFGSALPIRNISSAALVLRDDPERQFVDRLEVTFKAPITGNVEAFARALATTLGVAVPTATDEGKRKRLDFANGNEKRGRVLLDLTAKGLQGIEIIRADAR